MAEELEIVIFPRYRLSELKKAAAFKKERLDLSWDVLKHSVRKSASPLNFIKKHPGKILGGVTSIATMLGLLLGLKGQAKKVTVVKSGFTLTRSLLAWAGTMALKAVLPAVMHLVQNGVHRAFNGKDRD